MLREKKRLNRKRGKEALKKKQKKRMHWRGCVEEAKEDTEKVKKKAHRRGWIKENAKKMQRPDGNLKIHWFEQIKTLKLISMRFEFLISPISASSSRRIEAFEIQSLNGHFARFHLGSIWVRRASEEERKKKLALHCPCRFRTFRTFGLSPNGSQFDRSGRRTDRLIHKDKNVFVLRSRLDYQKLQTVGLKISNLHSK